MNDSISSSTVEFVDQANELLEQSMIKLENCLGQLSDTQIWWIPEANTNSIANQALHMCGNLRQWAVVSLLNQPDDRKRDDEFTSKQTHTTNELLDKLRASVRQASESIQTICQPHSKYSLTDRITIQGFEVSVCQAIMHTTSHFVGHTHQIILLTRLQLGDDYNFAWLSDGDRKRLPI